MAKIKEVSNLTGVKKPAAAHHRFEVDAFGRRTKVKCKFRSETGVLRYISSTRPDLERRQLDVATETTRPSHLAVDNLNDTIIQAKGHKVSICFKKICRPRVVLLVDA